MTVLTTTYIMLLNIICDVTTYPCYLKEFCIKEGPLVQVTTLYLYITFTYLHQSV